MIVKAIYHGLKQVFRVYRNGELVFLCDPIEFHVIEDGKLIIVGALVMNDFQNGLYLDCAPDWVYPVQDGTTLTLTQAYTAALNGTTLEVT